MLRGFQVRKIVGHVAPSDFTQRVELIARTHHEDLAVRPSFVLAAILQTCGFADGSWNKAGMN